jgi:hypothetical protein
MNEYAAAQMILAIFGISVPQIGALVIAILFLLMAYISFRDLIDLKERKSNATRQPRDERD